ncbi:hypothetical protein [Polyangium spumosum]|uniref:Disintegrin domain-containing protein n=1 Tax=Polyangium spumosum TaxID=889282 RepID=A0A6N7PHH8_9BACT|nr:hypothetical protein [Polyangium spumosum]MRG91257.1 hypothetical protein [Polyangium spumosum]
MPHRPRVLSVLLTTLLSAAAIAQIASCGLDTSGSRPPEDTEACVADANCEDQNPCTIDACAADGVCSHVALGDGPLPGQTAGDCQRIDCVAGAVVTMNDDVDVEDDGESCTNDACSMGAPVHPPEPNGTSCLVGGAQGTCQGGACQVSCDAQTPCDDGNACTEDVCNVGIGACLFTDLDGLPTPGYESVPGDCVQRICVAGEDTAVVDDTDVPVDVNPCTLDVCTMGAPTNPPVTAGEPCEPGEPEVCDGASSCVQCNEPADCVHLPPDDVCQQRTCVNHVCGQTFADEGTPFSTQTTGDCKRVVCDGLGLTQEVADDVDLPNDNNACTKNVCTDGAPSFPPEAINTGCGQDLYCDGDGTCVGCNVASQCQGTDDFCKVRTCINNECGVSLTAAGTDLPDGQTAMDCRVVECDAQGNIVTSVDTSDIPIDGNECTDDVCSAAGVPSNPDRPLEAACSQDGGTVCDGSGSCKKADAEACGGAVECLSGHCVDGVCCNVACGDTCTACDVPGSVGTCVNVPAAVEDDPFCTGANACDGDGACKKDDAEACVNADECVSGSCADGVCCDIACDTACEHCNLPGTIGICTMITSVEDTSPADICAGTRSCDATGVCRSKDGDGCLVPDDCLGGFCVDGVCCDTACVGTCQACSAVKTGGPNGICAPIPPGVDPDTECPANNVCSGAGTCVANPGESCLSDAVCASGHCVDGVCCDSACMGTCEACSTDKKGSGDDGVCGPIAKGADPDMECTMPGVCDGAGMCIADIGEACANDAACGNGTCVDGFCCATACDVDCYSCGLDGTEGQCLPVPANENDGTCAAADFKICDGAGTCLGAAGFTCKVNENCLSGKCVDEVCEP